MRSCAPAVMRPLYIGTRSGTGTHPSDPWTARSSTQATYMETSTSPFWVRRTWRLVGIVCKTFAQPTSDDTCVPKSTKTTCHLH